MNMTFTITKLVNDRVVVSGTDSFGTSGKEILDATQWNEINGHSEYDQAVEAFERAVESFFAPITEAAEKMQASLERPTDSLGYVVLSEGSEATPAQEEVLVKLTRDSIILRLLDQGDEDRLVWVNDQLDVLAVVPDEPGPAETFVDATDGDEAEQSASE
jgi:hypothetical protein